MDLYIKYCLFSLNESWVSYYLPILLFKITLDGVSKSDPRHFSNIGSILSSIFGSTANFFGFVTCYYLGSFILGLQIDHVWVFVKKLRVFFEF